MDVAGELEEIQVYEPQREGVTLRMMFQEREREWLFQVRERNLHWNCKHAEGGVRAH